MSAFTLNSRGRKIEGEKPDGQWVEKMNFRMQGGQVIDCPKTSQQIGVFGFQI